MSCERVRRQLGVLRELDRTERRAVAQHLRTCEACRQQWRDEQAVRSLVCGVPLLEPPRGLETRLLAIPASLAPRPLWPRPLPWLALAGLGLFLGAATLLWGPSPATPDAGTVPAVADLAAAPAVADLAAAPAVADRPSATAVARRFLAASPAWPAVEALEMAFGPGGDAAPADRPPAVGRRPAGGRAAPARAADEDFLAPSPTDLPGRSAPERPTRAQPTPTSPPPAATAEPTSVHACVTITALVFADLAGEGTLACPGCDGLFSTEDRDLAAVLGLSLPPEGMQLAVYDLSEAGGNILVETSLAADGPAASHDFGPVCGLPPFMVQLKLPAGHWSACPVTGSLLREAAGPGSITVTFPLSAGCPAPTPPPTATPEASPTGAQPGADPEATPTSAQTPPTGEGLGDR